MKKQKMSVAGLLAEVKAKGYFVSKVPPSRSGLKFKADLKRWKGNVYRFGVISCTHLGSKYQQISHLHSFYGLCKKEGVYTVFHCGDVVDGEKIYRGMEYELFAHGADQQVDYAVKFYPRVEGIVTKAISGN